MTKAVEIASPCKNTCQLHPQRPWCMGCGRDLDEIRDWPDASAETKRAILARLPERLSILAESIHNARGELAQIAGAEGRP